MGTGSPLRTGGSLSNDDDDDDNENIELQGQELINRLLEGSIVDGADKRPGYQISEDNRKRAKLGMTSGKRSASICTT